MGGRNNLILPKTVFQSLYSSSLHYCIAYQCNFYISQDLFPHHIIKEAIYYNFRLESQNLINYYCPPEFFNYFALLGYDYISSTRNNINKNSNTIFLQDFQDE